MDSLSAFIALIFKPITGFFDPGNPWSLYCLALCLAFTLGYVVIARLKRGTRDTRLKAFFRFVFDGRVWLHRSSLLDYKLYAVNTILMASVLAIFIVTSVG